MAPLQVAQQVDDLRLHRHVEGRGRLVQHHEARLQHHGAGDGDALALAAGELVGIPICVFREKTDLFQQFRDAVAPLRAVATDVLGDHALLDDGIHRHSRIE